VVIERATSNSIRKPRAKVKAPAPSKAARPERRRPTREEAEAARPRPGIDSRIWDHDLVELFCNVYRLGHRTEFDAARLLKAIREAA
jgi:hypothetical protein